jgi:hypothetical protein
MPPRSSQDLELRDLGNETSKTLKAMHRVLLIAVPLALLGFFGAILPSLKYSHLVNMLTENWLMQFLPWQGVKNTVEQRDLTNLWDPSLLTLLVSFATILALLSLAFPSEEGEEAGSPSKLSVAYAPTLLPLLALLPYGICPLILATPFVFVVIHATLGGVGQFLSKKRRKFSRHGLLLATEGLLFACCLLVFVTIINGFVQGFLAR